MHMFPAPDPNADKIYCGGDLETALNISLGNLINLSARAQAFHWNVEGPEFHQYHQFFQVVYEDLYGSVDGFAENILMAGYSLPMSLKKILAYSTLQCADVEPTPESLSRSLYESNKKCIEDYTSTVKLAESLGKDLGFVSAQIELQKKWDWQLRSIIKDADAPSPTSVTHIDVDIEIEVESEKSEALNKIFKQELNPNAYDPMLASALVPEEKALEEALRQIVREHGKFNEDGTGVWAGYTPASENQDASIGVKCENCVFFLEEGQCEIIALEIEAEGKCRFAVLPEGVVDTEEVLERDFNILELARTAAGGHQAPAEVLFDPKTEKELKRKVKKFNDRSPSDKKLSFSTLKAVYRRGALSYPEVNRSGRSRDDWAMDRATAFIRLFSAGKSSNPAYTHDNDLLPPNHPEFLRNEATILASGKSVENLTDYEAYIEAQLQPDIRVKTSDYTSVSDAILSVVEVSGLGYGAEVAFKAAWMRAINEGSDPYERVKSFAMNTYNSIDADLLPEKETGEKNE